MSADRRDRDHEPEGEATIAARPDRAARDPADAEYETSVGGGGTPDPRTDAVRRSAGDSAEDPRTDPPETGTGGVKHYEAPRPQAGSSVGRAVLVILVIAILALLLFWLL